MKILRLYALVDIARYQSNLSEYEGKSPKKEWKIWIRGAAEDSYFSRFLRTFSWIFWKVTRMSAISDIQHNQTEYSEWYEFYSDFIPYYSL